MTAATPGLRIALLAKAPVPGLAKTRLAPALGAEGAATLAARLLRHATAQAAAAAPGGVTLWAAPDTTHPLFGELQQAHGLTLAQQPGGDLGTRMAQAFRQAGAEQAGPVLLMGADIPALDTPMLHRAAAALRHTPVVFVPALDGGYALVGLQLAQPALLAALFDGMKWSTPQVLAHTLARLAATRVACSLLPPVGDIDEPEDLAQLPADWCGAGAGAAAGSHGNPR